MDAQSDRRTGSTVVELTVAPVAVTVMALVVTLSVELLYSSHRSKNRFSLIFTSCGVRQETLLLLP